MIHPVQEFREGFRTAGDDILYGIIKDALIPCFIKHLEKFKRQMHLWHVQISFSQLMMQCRVTNLISLILF